jgi:DNA-binding beta-propeller fold protein YncE
VRGLAAAKALAFAALALVAACGSAAPDRGTPPSRTAAEPQTAPSPSAQPEGTVLPIGDTPEGVLIDDVHHLVVVALRHPDSLALVTLTSPRRVRTVGLPGRARHLRFAASVGPVLVPGEDSGHLYEVGLPSGEVVTDFVTGRQPHDAVLAAGRIWVTNELAGTVQSLGPGGHTLPAGLQPGGLAAAADRVAVADVRGNRLYIFDAVSQRSIAELPAGAGPTHVVQTGPTTIAVADTRGNAVLHYDLSGKPRMNDRVALPGGPYGLAADPSKGQLWVALSGRNLLVRFDVRAGRLDKTSISVRTVQQPNSVAISDSGTIAIAGAVRKGLLQLVTPIG